MTINAGVTETMRIRDDGRSYERALAECDVLGRLARFDPRVAGTPPLGLDLPDSEVRRRVLSRRLCANCGMDYSTLASSPHEPGQCDSCGGALTIREDDNEAALAVRLKDYHEKTNPVLDLFRRKEYVITVDARPDPVTVQQQIRRELGLPPLQDSQPERQEQQEKAREK